MKSTNYNYVKFINKYTKRTNICTVQTFGMGSSLTRGRSMTTAHGSFLLFQL